MTKTAPTFTYEPWRHGGWYVNEVQYAAGGTGCVSRNYEDHKWRIVCDDRPNAHERFTYPSREAAALAEYELAEAGKAIAPKCPQCGCYEARHARERGWCYGCGPDCAKKSA